MKRKRRRLTAEFKALTTLTMLGYHSGKRDGKVRNSRTSNQGAWIHH